MRCDSSCAGPEQGGGLRDRAPLGDKNAPTWRAAGPLSVCPELGVPQGAQWPPPQAAGQPVCASHCAPGHGWSPEDTCERLPCHGATSTLGHRLPAPPRQPRSNGAGEASAAPPGVDRRYQAPPHRCPLGAKRLDVGFPSGGPWPPPSGIKAKRFCCRCRRKRLPNLPTAEQGGLGEKARNRVNGAAGGPPAADPSVAAGPRPTHGPTRGGGRRPALLGSDCLTSHEDKEERTPTRKLLEGLQ